LSELSSKEKKTLERVTLADASEKNCFEAWQ